MSVHFLDFERPVAELEAKIEEQNQLKNKIIQEYLERQRERLNERLDNLKEDSLDAFLHLWDELKEAIYAK